jgi:heme/copper-type cytochrome/quinol oxidase subunit 1
MGVISEIIPTFARKPISEHPHRRLQYRHRVMVFVWAHHMFVTGESTTPRSPFRSSANGAIIPSAVFLTDIDPLQGSIS